MERDDALKKLSTLEGRNLHEVAQELEVRIQAPDGKVNKGWAGHAIERFLGLPLNSSQSPNFGSWELKVIPLKRLNNGQLAFKETMAVTMIDPYQVSRTNFENSHLLAKLRKAIVVVRIVGKTVHEPSTIFEVCAVDLSIDAYKIIENDYETVRMCINDEKRGFNALTGAMGRYIQPRTKGAGHGSTSRAFYARKEYLSTFIKID